MCITFCRFVVLRRIFFIGGIHYFYRSVTMYITVLPKADPHYQCAPKLNETSAADIARRVLKLLSGMGLSINGQHVYCGDYIYSGHTMTLLMTFLIIKECKRCSCLTAMHRQNSKHFPLQIRPRDGSSCTGSRSARPWLRS